MFKTKGNRTTSPDPQRLTLWAQKVMLISALERARLEGRQLVARYRALDLADHEIPGIRRALGIVVTLKRSIALVEAQLGEA